MNDLPLAEYGVAIFTIGALVFVIMKFLKHMQKKDEAFSYVINNHLSEDKEVKEKLVASNQALAKSHERLEGAIVKLVDKL